MADYRRLTPQDLWLTFTAEDPLSDHDPISRAVKRWRISVGVNPFDDPQTLDVEVPDDGVIGHAEASVLNLGGAHEAGINPLEALDAISAELHHLSEVYDDEEGWWSEDLHLADIGGLALLVETIELKPRYRGLGLGPAVLAGITERLGTGCSFAALEPSPIGDPLAGKSVDDATRSLERLWRTVGFEPFRNGVWVLDLGTDAFQSCRRGILGE